MITLCYKGGPQVSLRSSLIQHDGDGRRWLKFRPSSHTISKLVLGHMEESKKAKNPSLAAEKNPGESEAICAVIARRS